MDAEGMPQAPAFRQNYSLSGGELPTLGSPPAPCCPGGETRLGQSVAPRPVAFRAGEPEAQRCLCCPSASSFSTPAWPHIHPWNPHQWPRSTPGGLWGPPTSLPQQPPGSGVPAGSHPPRGPSVWGQEGGRFGAGALSSQGPGFTGPVWGQCHLSCLHGSFCLMEFWVPPQPCSCIQRQQEHFRKMLL